MDRRINIVIDHYEEERARLLQLIEEDIAEGDYLMAHLHSVALNVVNARLYILNNISDNHYDRKEYLKSKITHLTAIIEKNPGHFLNSYYAEKLTEYETELAELRIAPATRVDPGIDHINSILQKLLKGHLQDFTLMINEKKNFFFQFSKLNNKLSIDLPNTNKSLQLESMRAPGVDSLEKIGFRETGNDKFTLEVPFNSPAHIEEVTILLAKLIFELLPFTDIKGSYIKV